MFKLKDLSPLTLTLLIGFGAFFFGFGAGALLNLYLLKVGSPLVTQLRSILTFKSAILGDGLVLPLITMIAAWFLLQHQRYITRIIRKTALAGGTIITLYFHITQAVRGLINWAMPTPWHWNLLGVWHAVYMFSISSFLSLFFIVSILLLKRQRRIPWQLFVVSVGLLLFFLLLELDYR